ncbi:hypothetical protein SNEBB_004291 [Seison nebaliae]|nr:hypothetical protein SNEBB_004291 [Seison nebaliae]
MSFPRRHNGNNEKKELMNKQKLRCELNENKIEGFMKNNKKSKRVSYKIILITSMTVWFLLELTKKNKSVNDFSIISKEIRKDFQNFFYERKDRSFLLEDEKRFIKKLETIFKSYYNEKILKRNQMNAPFTLIIYTNKTNEINLKKVGRRIERIFQKQFHKRQKYERKHLPLLTKKSDRNSLKKYVDKYQFIYLPSIEEFDESIRSNNDELFYSKNYSFSFQKNLMELFSLADTDYPISRELFLISTVTFPTENSFDHNKEQLANFLVNKWKKGIEKNTCFDLEFDGFKSINDKICENPKELLERRQFEHYMKRLSYNYLNEDQLTPLFIRIGLFTLYLP